MTCVRVTLVLIAVFCVFGNSSSHSTKSFFKEPVCSKYHYEEHVLAKLIRVELTTDLALQKFGEEITGTKEKLLDLNEDIAALKNESKKTKERAISEVSNLKGELINLKTTSKEDTARVGNEVSDLKVELDTLETISKKDTTAVANEVSDLKVGLSTLETASKKEITAVANEVSDLKNELTTLKNMLKTDFPTKAEFEKSETNLRELMSYHASSVVFVARNPPTSLPYKNTIIFSTAVLNTGSAYDTSTGAFTAPVSGVYMFSTQLCSVSGYTVYFQLVINDKVLGVSNQCEANYSGVCSSMVTVATMKSGQQALVKSSGSKLTADSISHRWNMFTGVLITQTSD